MTEGLLGVVLGLDDLLAAVETGGRDVVAQVHFTGRGFNCNCRIGQSSVRAMVAAASRGLLILLNSHFYSFIGLKDLSGSLAGGQRNKSPRLHAAAQSVRHFMQRLSKSQDFFSKKGISFQFSFVFAEKQLDS
jgi:hypothetical protein